MSYKIIDGKAYELKEVDIESIKKEIKKEASLIADSKAKEEKLLSQKESLCTKARAKMSNYSEQIAKLQECMQRTESKLKEALDPIEAEIRECDVVIESSTTSLMNKKDIINLILPEESKKLGL